MVEGVVVAEVEVLILHFVVVEEEVDLEKKTN